MGWDALAGMSSVPILGSEIQNRVNRAHAREAHSWDVDAANTQMAFQERMRNTAHQSEVEDLQEAGLNPILSANGGAAVPSGAFGGGASIAPAENALGKGLTAAMDAIRLRKELEGIDSKNKLNEAMGTAALAGAQRDASTAKQNDATTRLLDATFGASAAEAKTREGQAKKDLQYQNFDNLQRRIKNGLDTLNSAKDAVTPKIPGIRLKKDESIVNTQTGEIRLP